jgi:hypothetical protein
MIRDMVFGAAGGLGLFLFGMGLMLWGCKKVVTDKKMFLVFCLVFVICACS